MALDLLFVLVFPWGVAGAAWATVIAQYFSGLGLAVFTLRRCPDLLPKREELRFDAALLREIFSLSSLTCVQQSVMNFGILMIQGLVNSFGEIVMAAFAAAVKIESFAYMPAQDFSNAFSTFVAQNFGARQTGRIRAGIRRSFALVLGFCAVISAAVLLFASPLMRLFIPAADTEVIREGVYYLRCVAPFYFGIGFLFLFLRVLPRGEKARDVRCADGRFARHARRARVSHGRDARRHRHLGRDPHRVGARRYHRRGVLLPETEGSAAGNGAIKKASPV